MQKRVSAFVKYTIFEQYTGILYTNNTCLYRVLFRQNIPFLHALLISPEPIALLVKHCYQDLCVRIMHALKYPWIPQSACIPAGARVWGLVHPFGNMIYSLASLTVSGVTEWSSQARRINRTAALVNSAHAQQFELSHKSSTLWTLDSLGSWHASSFEPVHPFMQSS
jgi:hypothetical protein